MNDKISEKETEIKKIFDKKLSEFLTQESEYIYLTDKDFVEYLMPEDYFNKILGFKSSLSMKGKYSGKSDSISFNVKTVFNFEKMSNGTEFELKIPEKNLDTKSLYRIFDKLFSALSYRIKKNIHDIYKDKAVYLNEGDEFQTVDLR